MLCIYIQYERVQNLIGCWNSKSRPLLLREIIEAGQSFDSNLSHGTVILHVGSKIQTQNSREISRRRRRRRKKRRE